MAEEEGHQTARKKVDPSFIGNSSTNHNRAGLLKELRALNVTAKELVNEGYSLDTLKIAGYSMKELVGAGFTLDQLFQANVSKGLRASGATFAICVRAVTRSRSSKRRVTRPRSCARKRPRSSNASHIPFSFL